MESRAIKIKSPKNSKISIKVIPGHFATNHSHINYYIDMTSIKHRHAMAYEAASDHGDEVRKQHHGRHNRMYGWL